MMHSSAMGYCALILCILLQAEALTPTSNTLPTGLNPPNWICSSYCMYEINSTYNYVSQCSQSYNGVRGDGYCLKCDPLFFRAVAGPNLFYCIPHLYNGESDFFFSAVNIQLGYFDANNVAVNKFVRSSVLMFPTIPAIPSHYALRVRFGVYLHLFNYDVYAYPLEYNIDDKAFQYNQVLDKYWSPYDIITS